MVLAETAKGVDFAGAITTAFGKYSETLLAVAGVGLGIAFVMWGFPKAVRFFKKLAS